MLDYLSFYSSIEYASCVAERIDSTHCCRSLANDVEYIAIRRSVPFDCKSASVVLI